ncbi:isocitrate lyase/phosphoenolpyruvate mutase family protein [Streptomyces sp. NPDC047108]|uniref:isocitrate lyase/PEP mutase family protein n=1 Tax=Streptomyces sp. NPDC047108 TaxID=3155025 RepID=UPI0033EDE157
MTDDRFAAFRDLHHADRPLLLPNAWDHASAAALAARGFAAIGTTSLGVAAAAGLPDAEGATRDRTLALARRLVRLPALITVDIEGGFAERPDEVAASAAGLADAGVVGVNIEDGRPDGSLAPQDHQCAVIAAVKERAPRLFVNARTDTYWLKSADAESETLRRTEAYERAGADGIFVPGLQDPDGIRALVSRTPLPLNVLFAPGRQRYEELAALGVRRISTGSLLFRASLHGAVELARGIVHPSEPAAEIPSYAEAAALAAAFADPPLNDPSGAAPFPDAPPPAPPAGQLC